MRPLAAGGGRVIVEAAVGFLVAAAALAPTIGRGRRARVVARALAAPVHRREAVAPWAGWPLSRERRAPSPDVQLVVAQVVALLRAGASPGWAWQQAAGIAPGADGVPDAAVLAPRVGGQAALAVAAASRLATDLGAPLAVVLTDVAATVAAEARGRSEREAAFAGPRTTARVLGWLPLAGLGLGVLLGANPVRTALDGGVGSGSAVVGLVLLLVGRRWTAILLDRARRAGAG